MQARLESIPAMYIMAVIYSSFWTTDRTTQPPGSEPSSIWWLYEEVFQILQAPVENSRNTESSTQMKKMSYDTRVAMLDWSCWYSWEKQKDQAKTAQYRECLSSMSRHAVHDKGEMKREKKVTFLYILKYLSQRIFWFEGKNSLFSGILDHTHFCRYLIYFVLRQLGGGGGGGEASP